MNIENYLQKTGKQKIQEENKLKIVETPELGSLCKYFSKFLAPTYNPVNAGEDEKKYALVCNFAKNVRYTAKDILSFSIKMKEYENKDLFSGLTGVFLSALTNTSQENDFEVVIQHLSETIDCLGFKNKKNLLVKGNSGSSTGHFLTEGKVIITGDMGDYSGAEMFGGEIHVNGELENLLRGRILTTATCKAKIYHKGELIYDRSNRLFKKA